MNPGKLNSLINLIDDPNNEVYEIASTNLINAGESVIQELEDALLQEVDEIFQTRVKNIISQIHIEKTTKELEAWVKNGAINLLEGVSLIAKSRFYDIDTGSVKEQIIKIAKDIWIEINPKQDPLEHIRIFNHIILEKYGLEGNRANYIDPFNFYINKVLEVRRGSPILLSIIYIAIAQELSIPIYGVNLPGNFVLAYNNSEIIDFHNSGTPKYYINPFNSGKIFKKDEIDKYLKQHKLKEKQEYYNACDNIKIIKQLINDLKFIYKKKENNTEVICLNKLEEVF